MTFFKTILPLLCVGLCYASAQTTGKHDILVSSAAIQHLYRNCGNFVNVNVPDLCSDYNPICTATEADIQQSTETRRKFLIVPRGNKCILSVSNNIRENPELLGTLTFNVIEPPKPFMEILVNGQRATSSTAASKGSRLTIKIEPDPEFAAAMPQTIQCTAIWHLRNTRIKTRFYALSIRESVIKTLRERRTALIG